jgi:hypothetical protein
MDAGIALLPVGKKGQCVGAEKNGGLDGASTIRAINASDMAQ